MTKSITTISDKNKARNKIQDDIDSFIKAGGEIEELPHSGIQSDDRKATNYSKKK